MVRNSNAVTAEEALLRVVEERRADLVRTADRVLRNRDDAEDALQSALLNAIKSIERFRGESLQTTWLYRILLNCCLMEIRRRRSEQRMLRGFAASGRPGHEPARRDGSDDDWRWSLRGRLDDLTALQREVIYLRDSRCLSVADTAAHLDLSPGAVKVAHHRARRQLARALAAWSPEAAADRDAAGADDG